MIEVELKFEISPGATDLLEAAIDALPAAHLLQRAENTDIYYDTPRFDCLRQAVFVRVRNNAHLEIKYHESADHAHTHSTERSFPMHAKPGQLDEFHALCSRFLADWQAAGTIAEALRVNGLEPFAPIEKRRSHYACGDLTICIDRVSDLGDFLEIETLCAVETQTDEALAELNRFVAALHFPHVEPVRVGYVELWLRRHLPEVYRLGKYRVEATSN